MTALFTRRDYEALPEGFPVELHNGKLVKNPTPRFRQHRIQSRILAALADVLPPDRFAPGPLDVLADEITVLVPDIVVHESVPDDEAQHVGVPLVVFEVLSLLTRDRDRDFKTRRYLGLGIKEVWLIDRQAQEIEVVTLNGGHPATNDQIAKSHVIEGFALIPVELFAAPRPHSGVG